MPLFIGFVEAGIPLGVTFAFLISSPMVNEVALVLLWGLFSPWIALIYMAAGLTTAIIGEVVIGRLGMERYAALSQRRGHDPDRSGVAREGHASGHDPRLHDGDHVHLST